MKISMKAARVNAEMTQENAANALGITKETLRNYENQRTFPDVKMSQKIAALYGLNMDDIIFCNDVAL